MLRIQAFGELVVLRARRRVGDVARAPHRQALLTLLACHGAAGVSRARALALLAPDGSSSPPSWTGEMAALRELVGEEHLVVSPDAVALDAAAATSDVIEFRDAIAAGELERAVRLHGARLVDGFHHREAPAFERWLQLQREALASDAAAALERLAVDATRRGEPQAAVRWWRQLAAQHPLNDRVAASLMQALVAAGDRAGAVRHARFVEALAEQRLDLPADARVRALAATLRAEPARPDPLARFRAAIADRYTVEHEVGRGGHGRVLRAVDVRHGRAVAIKVLHPELAPALSATRFAREIRLVAALHHPHILPLFDSGVAGGTVYYVMPFVEGETLRARLDRAGPLPVAEAVAIATQVAGALAAAHARGIVHRDIKPENLLLADGQAQLVDFGIACALDDHGDATRTAPGHVVGTPAYMSPEQASDDAVDGRTDVYSLGCVLHEMLTGEPPFAGGSTRAILMRHATEEPVSARARRADVPEPLAAAVRRALAKHPDDRFASAADLARALREALHDTPPPRRARGVLPAARAPWLGRLLAALLTLALLVALP